MHIINKLFKKTTKFVLLFCPIVCIPIVSISCKKIYPRIHFVGSEWVVGEGEYQSTFKFNAFNYQVIDNNLEIKASITIVPPKCGYDLFNGEKDKFIFFMRFPEIQFFSNKTKSIEQSGFDVFGKIWNERICVYVYYIPLSIFKDLKNEYDSFITQDEPNVLFRVYIDPLNSLFFEINGFDIIDNQSTNN
ncbi:MAG: hypothetical protein K2O21_02995 [Malacoplasma sp.]|nr:hypothetical protein [Malacoplasma sp.]MDE7075578.1 hypothetical protein [Malacoplasma sp.]